MIRRHLMPQSYTADDELQLLGQASGTRLGPVIRCLLWNIFKAKRNHWLSDFSDLSADRDLIMLQEAVLNAPTDPIFIQDSRHEWIMARSFRHPLTHTVNGVKTGAVAPALERHFYLSPHAEPVLQTHKLLLATEYPLKDESERLLVLNMHAVNFVSVSKYVDQIDQISTVLSDHSGPVILGGDFNTRSPSRLRHFKMVAKRAGLSEAPMKRQSKLVHMNHHLDHLFYRGFKLRSVDSLAHVYSSDHAPITATFERDAG
ncbi:MAG: endonuclease/exonuclease/phosphatase family protein [Granulosicoccus sp.]|nr:endonuclease/exonuclease/phosphatase family protein [Granulosicoccus sp.]